MVTFATRFPSVTEAAGYLRQAVSLLNREGGIALLFIVFLALQWGVRAAVTGAARNDAVARPAAAWLTAVLFTAFVAAAVHKVRRAVAGQGVRWLPALREAATSLLRSRPAEWLVAGLLAAVLVVPPMMGRDTGTGQLLAEGGGTLAAAGVALALLARGRGRGLMAANLLLLILAMNLLILVAFAAGFLYVAQVSAAVGGTTVGIEVDNRTVSLPLRVGNVPAPGPGLDLQGQVVFLCPADTAGLLDCLGQNLPPDRFSTLRPAIANSRLISDGVALLSVPAAALLLLPRLVLLWPAAVLGGGLGFRRSWQLTRTSLRTSFWLVAMVFATGAVLALALGLPLAVAGAAASALLLVHRLRRGLGLSEAARSPGVLGGLAVAGLGLVLMLLPVLGPLLARLFALAVGGTAVTLFYLKLTARGSTLAAGVQDSSAPAVRLASSLRDEATEK